MKYLSFIRHPESHRASPPPAALMEAMGKFVERSLKDGNLVDTGGAAEQGRRPCALANGKITVTDGPFSESKGGHRWLGDPEHEVEGRGDPDRHRVHGAAPQALARVRGRVRGAADVRPGHGPVTEGQRNASHGDGQGDEELRGGEPAEGRTSARWEVQRGAGEGRHPPGGGRTAPQQQGQAHPVLEWKEDLSSTAPSPRPGAGRRVLDLAGQVDGGGRRLGAALPRPDAR